MADTIPPEDRVTDPTDPRYDPPGSGDTLGRRRRACAQAGVPHVVRGLSPTGGRRNIATSRSARPEAGERALPDDE